MRFLVLLPLFLALSVHAQRIPYPVDDFKPPLDIPLYLSGTFGELRGNHFHSGIDIKTQGAVGKRIYSIADGYIYRINVSPTGFGKAIYIRHPNGLSSVYAHLKEFSDEIKAYVRQEQYSRESFALNLFPPEDKFPVKQGDLIAFSGNSGGSLGPHLHFEIRESATEKPINPLFFSFPIKDYVRPGISHLKLYSNGGFVGEELKDSKQFIVDGWGLKHRLRGADTINFSGNISFGIAVYDQSNDMPNRNGVYSVELYIDSVLFSHHEMERFSFAETRFINSLIDYAEYIENRIRFQRSEVDPNNPLPIYKKVINRGVYIPTDTLVHPVKYVIKDTYGNTSELKFFIRNVLDSVTFAEISSPPDPSMQFYWDRQNRYEKDDFRIETPAGAFYRDFTFTHTAVPGKDGFYSAIHKVHKNTFPVHKYVQIAIKADKLPERLIDRSLIVEVDEDGDISAAGGMWDNGYLKTSIRNFGNYAVTVDTVPPEIIPLNIHNGKKISGYGYIKIRIKDDLSGIDEYRAEINGNWVLMEYDAKNDLLVYEVDERLPKGSSKFSLLVTDNAKNQSQYIATINY